MEGAEDMAIVFNICSTFMGPICENIGSLREMLESLRGASASSKRRTDAVEESLLVLENSLWQIQAVRGVLRSYSTTPDSERLAGGEPVARAIVDANLVSYNVRPRVTRFGAPLRLGGVRSWEALRQPFDYTAYMRGAEDGDRLCRVTCGPDAVSITSLSTSEAVSFPEGTRFRWLRRNIEVVLRTGLTSYAAVFVRDRCPPRYNGNPTTREMAEWYDSLMENKWSIRDIEKYRSFHGELPDIS